MEGHHGAGRQGNAEAEDGGRAIYAVHAVVCVLRRHVQAGVRGFEVRYAACNQLGKRV